VVVCCDLEFAPSIDDKDTNVESKFTAGNELYTRRINLDFTLKGEPISSGQRESSEC